MRKCGQAKAWTTNKAQTLITALSRVQEREFDFFGFLGCAVGVRTVFPCFHFVFSFLSFLIRKDVFHDDESAAEGAL